MKLAGLINLLPLLLSGGINCQKQAGDDCDAITVRRDFHTAPESMKKTFFNTFRKWAQMKGQGSLHHFVYIHDLNEATSHSVPCFLVWHRKFLKLAENALKKIDPDFVFLYWDWSKDYQAPHRSILWQAKYAGTNGRGYDRIVRDGAFFNVTLEHPTPHLLKRDWDGGNTISPFNSPFSLQMMLDGSRNFYSIWTRLEDGPHAEPHDNIGGDVGDGSTMHSPNDLFFWLHHAFIDMLWWSWQQMNPDKALDYAGRSSELMAPWRSPVSDYLNPRKHPACSEYDRVFDYQIPSADPSSARNFFAASTRASKKSKTKTELKFSKKTSKYTYISIKAKNMQEIADSIEIGELPRFRVKHNEKDYHPDLMPVPKPISEKFAIMNHMNLTKLRELEKDNALQIEAYNALKAMENPEINNYFLEKQDQEDPDDYLK